LVDHSNKIASRLMIYQFYEQGYSERSHYEVVSEIQRLFNWTKGEDGYYRCVLDNPPEGTVKFLKIGNGSGEEYKGKTKVIVIAGGFIDKNSGKTAKLEQHKTERVRVLTQEWATQQPQPQAAQLQTQPQTQPQQHQQSPESASFEAIFDEIVL